MRLQVEMTTASWASSWTSSSRNRRASASENARRSRTATGAVLCETPRRGASSRSLVGEDAAGGRSSSRRATAPSSTSSRAIRCRPSPPCLSALARRAGIRPTELAEVMYFPRNCDAARQLYRVASGLESMIVGEAEVQGQVRRAYEAALAADTTGPLTNRLFSAALQTGRRVRSETQIGEGRTSVSTVAVDLAKDVVGHLAEREVVIIGAARPASSPRRRSRPRASRRSSSPTATRTARARWPSASAGPSCRSTICRASSRPPTSSSRRRRRRTRSSPPTRSPRSSAPARASRSC